jgi:thioredoxin-related protein
MKKLIHFMLIVTLPTLLVSFSSLQMKDKSPKPLKIGKEAPMSDVKLQNIDIQNYSLKDLNRENGLLVVFSCNTCPFVVGNDKFAGWEIQYNDLKILADSLKIGMTLINSNEAKRENEDSFEAMKTRASEKGYKMSYLLDMDSKLADAFGAKTTPHIFLFNKDLKLVYSGSIDNSWDSQRTEDISYLANAMGEIGSGLKVSTKESLPRGCSIKRIKK